VAVLLGWALAGEPLTARTLLAGAVIVGAVVLITTHRQKPAAAIEVAETEDPAGAPPLVASRERLRVASASAVDG
jgi:predicted anti-sigma-YlaC factor YlaD